MKKINNKYSVWLADSSCNPIEGTDRILLGPSQRWIMKHLAYESGVEYRPNSLIVRLPNGNFWNASKI